MENYLSPPFLPAEFKQEVTGISSKPAFFSAKRISLHN
jgi:hypothetical protein